MNYRTAPTNSAKAKLEAERLKLHGPPPTNPFKQLRLDHGFTHDNLCSRIFISKQALIRLEQGTYDSPLPSVLEWWANHVCKSSDCPANKSTLRPGEPIGELYLRDSYAEFQQRQRGRYKLCFGPSLEYDADELHRIFNVGDHPFGVMRDRAFMSRTEVAKSLCIPQATVEHFEKKFRVQQTVPKNLRYALKEIGYSASNIADFCAVYNDYRNNNRRSVSVVDSDKVVALP